MNGSLVDAVVGADDTTATKLRALGYRKVPAGWSGEPPDFYLRPGFELGAEREGATFVPLPPPGSTCAAYPTRKPAPDTALYPGGVDGDQVCTLCPCSRMATVSPSIQDLTSGACRSIAGNGKRVTLNGILPDTNRIQCDRPIFSGPSRGRPGTGHTGRCVLHQVCRVGGPSRHAGLTTPEGECSTSSERHSRNNMRPPSPAPPPRSPRHPHRGKHLPSGIDIWRPLDMLLAASNESKHEEERRSNTRTKHDSSHELLWMKIKITHRENGLSVGSHETDEPEWIRQLQQNATLLPSAADSAKLQASLLFNRSLHRKWLPVPPAGAQLDPTGELVRQTLALVDAHISAADRSRIARITGHA